MRRFSGRDAGISPSFETGPRDGGDVLVQQVSRSWRLRPLGAPFLSRPLAFLTFRPPEFLGKMSGAFLSLDCLAPCTCDSGRVSSVCLNLRLNFACGLIIHLLHAWIRVD